MKLNRITLFLVMIFCLLSIDAHADTTLLGSSKDVVDKSLQGWQSRLSNRSTDNEHIYYYSKDVEIVITFQKDIACEVAVIDRPGIGISPISEQRFNELVQLIGKAPKNEDIKRQNGIREFFVQQSSTDALASRVSGNMTTSAGVVSGELFYKKKSGNVISTAMLPVVAVKYDKEAFVPMGSLKIAMEYLRHDIQSPRIARLGVDSDAELYTLFKKTLIQELKPFVSQFVDKSPYKTITDHEGRFSLRSLPPGEYYIFALLTSTNVNGYWLLPVTVEANKTEKLTLDNLNLEIVIDES